MKLRNQILIGAAIAVGALSFAFTSEYLNYQGMPPYLQRTNVREKAHKHLTTLERTEYSKQVKIDGREYKVMIKKIEHWAHVKKGLELEVKNLGTQDEIVAVDIDDTLHYSRGNVGGTFYAEKPKFRSINKIYVNRELQETNKQREKEVDKFFKPLEKDLEGLANAKIRRQETAWNLARGIKQDFIEICSVEYMPPEHKGDFSRIIVSAKGYDYRIPERVHYYIDGKPVLSWEVPRNYHGNGFRVWKEEFESIKFTTHCLLNLEKGPHILKAVLEDNSGDKTEEDMKLFEVKPKELPECNANDPLGLTGPPEHREVKGYPDSTSIRIPPPIAGFSGWKKKGHDSHNRGRLSPRLPPDWLEWRDLVK